jgi:hypothetical protein
MNIQNISRCHLQKSYDNLKIMSESESLIIIIIFLTHTYLLSVFQLINL